MGAALYTAVTTPEEIGVLAWWGVLLVAAPLVLRRWRRGRSAGEARGAHERAARDVDANIQGLPAVSPIGGDPRSVVLASGGARHDRSRADDRAARLSSATLEPVCRYVDFRRRLEVALAELERKLSVLPSDRWRIEPYPLTGERRNTLLVLGATGVFVISATYAPGSWDDVVTVNTLARKIQSLLRGYAGEVHAAICHPFSSVRPRVWHRESEGGEWMAASLVGGHSVVGWLEHFGADQGLGPADLERFDELCRPNWLEPAILTPPTWPPIADRAPGGRDQ
jgi:hypothetical protein